MKEVIKVTDKTIVPLRVIFDAGLLDDRELSFDRSVLLHLGGGRRRLGAIKIPLGVVAQHLRSLELDGLSWGTGNVSNREWLALNLKETLQRYFRATIDPISLAKICAVPEESIAVSSFADTVNGMVVMQDGKGYVVEFSAWDSKTSQRLQLNEEELNTSGNSVVSAAEVIESVTSWNICRLQRICDRIGWDFDCSDLPTFNEVARRFKKIFAWNVQSGFDRSAVGDFDSALSNRRFMFACGSGSGIRVYTPLKMPKPEVRVA